MGISVTAIVAALCVSGSTRRLNTKRLRDRWGIVANVLVAAAITVYIIAAVDVGGTHSSPEIKTARNDDTGTVTVTVKVTRLTSGERLLVTAGWDEARAQQGQVPPTDVIDTIAGTEKGIAQTEFDVRPPSKDRPLFIVARVVKRVGNVKRIVCDDADRACSSRRFSVEPTQAASPSATQTAP